MVVIMMRKNTYILMLNLFKNMMHHELIIIIFDILKCATIQIYKKK